MPNRGNEFMEINKFTVAQLSGRLQGNSRKELDVFPLEALRNKRHNFIYLKLSLNSSSRFNWEVIKKPFASVRQAWKFRWVFFLLFSESVIHYGRRDSFIFHLTTYIWIINLHLNLCTSTDLSPTCSWNDCVLELSSLIYH